MHRFERWIFGALTAALGAVSAPALAVEEGDYEKKTWQEVEVGLPAAPDLSECRDFYVSAAAKNRFCIDPRSISVGADGVVRYTLVVDTPSGSRNVTFEGMRCETRERRLYATGQPDGTWVVSRNRQWVRISEATANRQHAALFLEYFCPDGIMVTKREEALDNLRRGGNQPKIRF